MTLFPLMLIKIIMKNMKNDVKTRNSQQSDIDPFTKLENSFLEKFFKYILADAYQSSLTNLYEQLSLKKQPDIYSKYLAQDLFLVSKQIDINDITAKIRSLLLSKSPTFLKGELTHLLQMKYMNRPAQNSVIDKDQLLFVDVRIKADIQRIEQLPEKMQALLLSIDKKQLRQCPIRQLIRRYKRQHINFMIVYYGQYNFELVRKQHYQKMEVCLFGRTIKLRLYVLFVSKIALLQTFKTINKVPNLEFINDLIIQFYQLKRQKAKRKKLKNIINKKEIVCQDFQKWNIEKMGLRAAIGIIVVGMVVFIRKFTR